jgi:hypothetical protein
MDQNRYMDIVSRVMSDEQPLPVVINIKEAWLLVSGLQLATRHPEISEAMRAALTNIARQFQEAIEQAHPEAGECLEFGWDPDKDV